MIFRLLYMDVYFVSTFYYIINIVLLKEWLANGKAFTNHEAPNFNL